MNVTVENSRLNDVQHELRVSVPAEHMREELERGMAAVVQHAQLPGFRPGKIPRNVLIQKFGPAVTEDTVQRVLQEAYKDALDQSKLLPVSPGEMSEIHFEPGQPLTFKVVVEVLPDVAIPPLEDIEVELRDPQAADEDIATALDGLRESQAVLIPSDDPIDDHSVITFDIQELDSTGLPLVGKSQKDITIDMSRNQFGEDFASSIKGLKCDGTTTHSFQRPGDPDAKSLKTQITVRNVQRKELPELDDAFAQSVNPNLNSLDDLRADLRRYVESRAAHSARQEMFRKLADELLRRSEYTVPPRMLENYLDRMAHEATHHSKNKPDEAALAKFREDYRVSAIWTLRWYLMRNSLIKTHDLRTSDEEVEQEIARMATLEDELADEFKKRLSPDQLQQITDDLQERKVLDFLEHNVKIVKTPVSLAEFEGRTAAPSVITE